MVYVFKISEKYKHQMKEIGLLRNVRRETFTYSSERT